MNNINEKTITPVAVIKTDFKDKFGIPRQSGRCKTAVGIIEFLPHFNSVDFIRGIEDFSHLWLIFGFNKNEKEEVSATVRPPRLGGNKRVGVFASRAPYRPNGLGLSAVKLERVICDEKGVKLEVSGVDILDGSPIFDIKPYIPSADKIDNAVGGFSENFTDYSLSVIFPKEYENLFSEREYQTLLSCLKDDPRPSYQKDGKVYGMNFLSFEIKFSVKEKTLTVLSVSCR